MKKRLSHLLVLISLLLSGSPLYAQTTYHAPAGVTLETGAECHRHTDDFLKATDYLLSSAVDDPGHKEAAAFVLKWLTNSPDVTIHWIDGNAQAKFKNADALLLVYMAAYAKYALNTNDSDESNRNLAGFHEALAYYKNPAFHATRTKRLDKLVQLQAEGRLDEEVSPLSKLKKMQH